MTLAFFFNEWRNVNQVLDKFTAAPIEVYSRLTARQACPVPYTICNKCYGYVLATVSESGEEDTGMHIGCMEDDTEDEEEDKEAKSEPGR